MNAKKLLLQTTIVLAFTLLMSGFFTSPVGDAIEPSGSSSLKPMD